MCVSNTCKTRGVALLRLPILLGVTEVLEGAVKDLISISIFINNKEIYYLRTLSNQGQYLKYNCQSLKFLELEVIMNIPDK